MESKSKIIKLYNIQKVEKAFEEAINSDEQPAFEVIIALKDKIDACLRSGRFHTVCNLHASASWFGFKFKDSLRIFEPCRYQ